MMQAKSSSVNRVVLFIRDFFSFILMGFVYSYAYQTIWYGGPYDKFLLPLVNGLFFGSVCFFVYTISFRIFRSKVLFFILSWVIVIGMFCLNLTGAKEAGLSQNVRGHDIFINGEITQYGMFHEFLDPIGVMAIWASVLLVSYCWRQRKNG